MSYYEKWLHALIELLVKSGLVTRAEIESGKPAPGSPKATPALIASAVCRRMVAKGTPASREVPGDAALHGGPARARAQHPSDRPHATAALRARQARHDRTATMASMSSRTPTPIPWARSRNMFTRCGSPRANCGGSKPRHAMLSISTCGTTTLSPPDSILETERLPALPRLPRDEGEPGVCRALAGPGVRARGQAVEAGHFTWKEWAAALADELKAAASRGEPDDGSHYYEHWLAALEHLVTAKGLTDPAAAARKEAWADAYRHTPHGKPVELVAASW